MVSGTWDYCSGIAHATHFMGNALIAGTTDRIAVVIPREQVAVLDDWGDGAVPGMNASGSNSVRVDAVFVPAHRTAPGDWTHWTPRRPASPCTATRCTAAGSTRSTTRAWSSR